MKYIVEIKPEYEDSFKGMMILRAKDSNLFVDALAVDDLEQLNAEYINNHFPDITKKVDEAHQRGLEDAWEAARKIVTWPDRSLVNSDTFDLDHGENIFTKYSASEAIAKLKAYEEKQKADDEIKVGDEVQLCNDPNVCFVVISIDTLNEDISGFNRNGHTYSCRPKDAWRKTGRHFDIESILEAMKE